MKPLSSFSIWSKKNRLKWEWVRRIFLYLNEIRKSMCKYKVINFLRIQKFALDVCSSIPDTGKLSARLNADTVSSTCTTEWGFPSIILLLGTELLWSAVRFGVLCLWLETSEWGTDGGPGSSAWLETTGETSSVTSFLLSPDAFCSWSSLSWKSKKIIG